jgi:hypothetical protein
MKAAPEESKERPAPKREPYRKPTLVEYGSISKLTQSGNGSGTDGGTTPGMTMTCI